MVMAKRGDLVEVVATGDGGAGQSSRSSSSREKCSSSSATRALGTSSSAKKSAVLPMRRPQVIWGAERITPLRQAKIVVNLTSVPWLLLILRLLMQRKVDNVAIFVYRSPVQPRMSVGAIRRLFIYVRRDAIFDSNHVTQHARHLFRRWVGRLFLTRNFWTLAPWQKLYCREAYGRTFLHACMRHRRTTRPTYA